VGEREAAKNKCRKGNTHNIRVKISGYHRIHVYLCDTSPVLQGGNGWNNPEPDLSAPRRWVCRASPSDIRNVVEGSIDSKQCRKRVSRVSVKGNKCTKYESRKGSKCVHNR
jgi:hypothetical protein